MRFQHHFTDIYNDTSTNKILAYNQSKDIKNIVDFKLKQFEDSFENDFNDLDDDIFEPKINMPIKKKTILVEEKFYDNGYRENNNDKENTESLYI